MTIVEIVSCVLIALELVAFVVVVGLLAIKSHFIMQDYGRRTRKRKPRFGP